MEITINYLAVLVAAIAAMVIGGVWYSPLGFGKPWMRLMGYGDKVPEGSKRAMMRSYAFMFAGALVMAFVLAHFAFIWGARETLSAVQLGFWTWLGFVAPVQLGTVLWEGKPWMLFFLNTAYYLVTLIAMAVIVGLWI